jgi:light-regulated signal transduction histidine kinase (bacteriophytochrome)
MNNVQESRAEFSADAGAGEVGIQPSGFLLELSLDWIVLRATENVHHLLGKSHVTLIDEPFGKFVQQQALHDLRNLFSRLSGTTGIARAYRVRLTEEHEYFDIAFQLSGGRVLLEAVPSSDDAFGEALGSVGGLIAGLSDASGEALLEGGARRMRALTGYDRVTLLVGGSKATSDRSGVPFRSGANATLSAGFPPLVANSAVAPVPVFPRNEDVGASAAALLRAPSASQKAELGERGFASTMRIPMARGGETIGEFRLAHTTPRAPSFELHAAAELFAQMFAMRLEIDALKAD